MPIDHGRDPWSGTTYKGFAGGPAGHPGPSPETPATPRRRRLPSRRLVAAGVAAALALGVAFGFWARPQLIGAGPAATTAAPSGPTTPASPPNAAQAPIAVAPAAGPAATAAPPPQGRLETLPPEMAATERAPVRPHEAGQAAVPASAAAPAEPAPPVRASFDCATARPGAEQMVCADPALAAADRQMAQAYRRALRSGVDPADLRQEQRDFLAIREDAARHSPRALAEVYDQRIQDLNQTADEGAADEGPDDDR